MEMILGTKFQFRLRILIIWSEFAQNGYFRLISNYSLVLNLPPKMKTSSILAKTLLKNQN